MWRYAYMSDEDEKPQITWALVRRVLSYARPYRALITIGLVLILIQSGHRPADAADLPRPDRPYPAQRRLPHG